MFSLRMLWSYYLQNVSCLLAFYSCCLRRDNGNIYPGDCGFCLSSSLHPASPVEERPREHLSAASIRLLRRPDCWIWFLHCIRDLRKGLCSFSLSLPHEKEIASSMTCFTHLAIFWRLISTQHHLFSKRKVKLMPIKHARVLIKDLKK